MAGKVEKYLIEQRKKSPLHFSLIDPQKVDEASSLRDTVKKLVDWGTDAFLVGGSLGVSFTKTIEIVNLLKTTGLPVIIFPGDVSNLVPGADAILFLSLLNSDNTYFIVGAQVQGAPLVKTYKLEPLPTAYIIVGYGGAAGYVGKARPIPWENPELVAAYSLAGWMMGMRFIYLEAGSGSPQPIPRNTVSIVRATVPEAFLIVGGGIRKGEQAKEIVNAGADAIVTGTLIEENEDQVKNVIQAIKQTKQ